MYQYQPLWLKAPVAILLALLLSISLLLNIIFALPMSRDVELLIGLLTGFILWVSLLAVFLASQKAWVNVYYGMAGLIVSIVFNLLYLKGVL